MIQYLNIGLYQCTGIFKYSGVYLVLEYYLNTGMQNSIVLSKILPDTTLSIVQCQVARISTANITLASPGTVLSGTHH